VVVILLFQWIPVVRLSCLSSLFRSDPAAIRMSSFLKDLRPIPNLRSAMCVSSCVTCSAPTMLLRLPFGPILR